MTVTALDLETFYNTDAQKRFWFPGRLFWGRDVRLRCFELIPQQGRVELVVDARFATDAFVRELRTRLQDRLDVTIVEEPPRTDAVDRLARRPAPALQIALGGGSSIDLAKSARCQRLYGTCDGVGIGERRGLAVLPHAVDAPLVALPTTAGTGAEASRYYVAFDRVTGGKVHGKSWRLVADWILLDPEFLRDAPPRLLVESAYDAFVHLFESAVCRYEASALGRNLSAHGIATLLPALEAVLSGDRGDEPRLALLYAATLGGIAISNVRTGNVHEAAGALLERTDLTHPQTLRVFFRAAVTQYRHAVADRERELMAAIRARMPGLSSFDDVLALWDRAFAASGADEAIARELAALREPGEVREHVFRRVAADRVWVSKESPVPLDEAAIAAFIDDGLSGAGRK